MAAIIQPLYKHEKADHPPCSRTSK